MTKQLAIVWWYPRQSRIPTARHLAELDDHNKVAERAKCGRKIPSDAEYIAPESPLYQPAIVSCSRCRKLLPLDT